MSVTYSFTSGTAISSTNVNANFTDVASEITGSLPRDGQAAMTGQLKSASGSVALPGMAFSSDTDTGFYRKAGDTIGIVAGGAEVATISTSGLVDSNSLVIVGLPTGVMVPYGATSAPAGWVRANGRTIGNASSGATERANADTSSLFSFLWTNFADAVCAVSTGRGASAAADYAANKTIGLPDMRGRGFFGLDDMGSTAAGRLGTIITTPTTNGSSGGTETHTLTQAQLPSYNLNLGSMSASGTISSASTGFLQNHANGTGIASGGDATAALFSYAQVSVTGNVSVSIGGTLNSGGSGSAHTNLPPAFLGTFIIKL